MTQAEVTNPQREDSSYQMVHQDQGELKYKEKKSFNITNQDQVLT